MCATRGWGWRDAEVRRRGGRGAGRGGGGGRPRGAVGWLAGGLRGRARGLRSGGSAGAARRAGGDAAAGRAPGRGARAEGAAAAAGVRQGRGVSWPGGPSGPGRRGRALHAACRFRPGSSCQGSAAAATAGRWEGGRGWLHRGSHSASSSHRRRHCVLSAPVARCGASEGGRGRRRTLRCPLVGRRQSGPGDTRDPGPGRPHSCPGLVADAGRCGLRFRVRSRAAPNAQSRGAAEAPAAASAGEQCPLRAATERPHAPRLLALPLERC